eukprot:6225923-Lingulodinium_polyedra.AAC.1
MAEDESLPELGFLELLAPDGDGCGQVLHHRLSGERVELPAEQSWQLSYSDGDGFLYRGDVRLWCSEKLERTVRVSGRNIDIVEGEQQVFAIDSAELPGFARYLPMRGFEHGAKMLSIKFHIEDAFAMGSK